MAAGARASIARPLPGRGRDGPGLEACAPIARSSRPPEDVVDAADRLPDVGRGRGRVAEAEDAVRRAHEGAGGQQDAGLLEGGREVCGVGLGAVPEVEEAEVAAAGLDAAPEAEAVRVERGAAELPGGLEAALEGRDPGLGQPVVVVEEVGDDGLRGRARGAERRRRGC